MGTGRPAPHTPSARCLPGAAGGSEGGPGHVDVATVGAGALLQGHAARVRDVVQHRAWGGEGPGEYRATLRTDGDSEAQRKVTFPGCRGTLPKDHSLRVEEEPLDQDTAPPEPQWLGVSTVSSGLLLHLAPGLCDTCAASPTGQQASGFLVVSAHPNIHPWVGPQAGPSSPPR